MESRKYDNEIENLMKMDSKEILKLYKNRKIEAEEESTGGN